MDADETTLPDEGGETEYPALTEDDWRADLMAYMGHPDGDDIQPGEFTFNDVMALYPHMSDSGLHKRFMALLRRGVYTRRRAIINGHSVWLYKKAE